MKVIKTTYYLLTCVFLAWLALSWLDVIRARRRAE